MPESKAEILTGFDCVADESSELLILGSMPGIASLSQQQYYAHPRNAFWKIMQELYAIPCELDYQQRLEQLKKNKIALWDVAYQCIRPGSLDSNIQTDTVQANDFYALFESSPNIQNVFFNGGAAAALYKKHVLSNAGQGLKNLQYHQLPSTSPANARFTFEQKVNAWKQIYL